MAYKQSPFPMASGTKGHTSALKQVGSATAKGEKKEKTRTIEKKLEDKPKTKMVEGTTVFGKTLAEWNAVISKYANLSTISPATQTLLNKARAARSKFKELKKQ